MRWGKKKSGLQCHTAPFSWKIVFECDHQLYEVIATSCSPKEELEWRSRLCRSVGNGIKQSDANLYSSLSLNIKSLGTVFGKPGKHLEKRPESRGEGLTDGNCRHDCAANLNSPSYDSWAQVSTLSGYSQKHVRRKGSGELRADVIKHQPITVPAHDHV